MLMRTLAAVFANSMTGLDWSSRGANIERDTHVTVGAGSPCQIQGSFSYPQYFGFHLINSVALPLPIPIFHLYYEPQSHQAYKSSPRTPAHSSKTDSTKSLYQHKLPTWDPLNLPNRTNSAELLCNRRARLKALLLELPTMATATAMMIALRRPWTLPASLLRRTVCYTCKTAFFQIS